MITKRNILLGLLIGVFISNIVDPVITFFIVSVVVIQLLLDFDEYCLKGADQHGKNY